MERKYKGKEAEFSESIFHLAFSKINMWGEKYSGIGETKFLAKDLIKELDKETIAKIKKLKKQKIVFLGDSLMAKLHWGAWGGYPDILCDLFNMLNRKVTVVNKAIGGQTSWQGLERLKRDVTDLKPDMCFVAFGGNDLAHTKGGKELKWMAKFRKSMTDIVLGCKKHGIRPVLLNGSRQYWIDDSIYKREVVDAIGAMGCKLKVPVIDSNGFTWTGPTNSWLCYDNLHLNNSGQVKFAKEIIRFLLG
jgi:lysophospholipase L1-like esterase